MCIRAFGIQALGILVGSRKNSDNHRPTEGVRKKGFQPSNHPNITFKPLLSHF